MAGLRDAFAEMEQEGRQRLGWFDGEVTIARSADMRYGEQVFEIPVKLDAMDWAAATLGQDIEAAFHRAHAALYTYALPEEDVVLVNARASVIGRLAPPAAPAGNAASAPVAPQIRRRVHLGGWMEVPVHDFAGLADRQEISGPAIVESDDTTVLLRPGDRARYDGRGWLGIEIALG